MANDQNSNPGGAETVSAEELAALLEETFFANIGQPAETRRAALAEAVASVTRGLSADETQALVEKAKNRLGTEAPPPPVESAGPSPELNALTADNRRLQARVEKLEGELRLRSAAYDHFVDLSNHFLGDNARFEKEEQIDRFCRRIKGSFSILTAAFKDLLKGRKRFQMEYAMYFQ